MWTLVQTVKGAGNSNEQINYEVDLYKEDLGKYLMLSQTDFDGTYQELDAIFTDFDKEDNINRLIVRNPCSKSKCRIKWNGGLGQLEILDTKGATVNSLVINKGFTKLNLQSGVYLLTVYSEGNLEEKRWLVVEDR